MKSNPTLVPEGQIYPLQNLCPQDNYQPFFYKKKNYKRGGYFRTSAKLFVPKRRRLKENKVFFFFLGLVFSLFIICVGYVSCNHVIGVSISAAGINKKNKKRLKSNVSNKFVHNREGKKKKKKKMFLENENESSVYMLLYKHYLIK